MSPAQRSIRRRCREGLTTPVTEKNCRLPGTHLWEWSSRIRRSSVKGLDTGRREKAPVRCPCSQLTAFHCATRTLLLLLLLSHPRCMRMISETLELRVEGGRVNHSCCMCVDGHGYGGLGGGRNGGGKW